MPYATQQDLIDRFGNAELVQLTDKVNRPASTIDVVPVDRALSDATALIDSYIGKLYRLPLSAVPPILVKYACDIARYYLHGKAAEKDDAVSRGFNEATTWLINVSKGLVALEAEGVTPPQAGGGSVQAVAPNRVFTRDSLRHL
ncbi:gp436 family protein [Neorhizobium petrolearium]|uniref:gp436 family protein n=1 Tax=Neorhizobium petrolearium TaxID=515361 RepID=UPI003F7DB0CA